MKRLDNLIAFLMLLARDTQAKGGAAKIGGARFDLFGIILMIIAIALGNIVGGMIAGWIGFAGGIIGVFVVGVVIYAIYMFATGGKIRIMGAVIFSVLIYIAQMLAGTLGGFVGVTGGIVTLVFTALIVSILWGWIGGKEAKTKAPIKL